MSTRHVFSEYSYAAGGVAVDTLNIVEHDQAHAAQALALIGVMEPL